MAEFEELRTEYARIIDFYEARLNALSSEIADILREGRQRCHEAQQKAYAALKREETR